MVHIHMCEGDVGLCMDMSDNNRVYFHGQYNMSYDRHTCTKSLVRMKVLTYTPTQRTTSTVELNNGLIEYGLTSHLNTL